ncbi:MAG: asparaginase [Pseudomonadota bacterium]|nr:asparaginase [Pseudomonadota bacterium]
MSSAATNPILVEAMRGSVRESAHRGAVAVLDADGNRLVALGDIERPVFPRSAVKLLQAIPLVEGGAADRLALDDEELAIACASHNGEPAHVAVVERMLAKAGLDVAALECGTHWPRVGKVANAIAAAGREPNALNNNCSGKHAGFLCLACVLCDGVNLRQYAKNYVAPRHPVMRAVTEALAAATGHDLRQAPRGIDGCSIPAFAIPLDRLALAFARVGSGSGLRPGHARAATRLRKAVAQHPFMAAGSDRFDTQVMEALGERVYCKVGAEAVFCASFPERGLGVAIKIDDGNTARAAEVTMAATIEAFVDLDDEEAALLRRLSEVLLRNWNGIEVGALRATSELRDAMPPIR